MADTVFTPDGKMHVLLGATNLESIIREYCGNDVADAVYKKLDYAERREKSDIAAYEADLDHIHSMMRDWVEELQHLANLCDNRKFTKATLRAGILGVIANIKNEM